MATATVQSDKDEQKPNVSAYLQAPRKKRKNYVIIACSEDIDAETVNQIEGFVKKQYPQLATSRPKTLKELTRQFGRNISLLIVDDRFEKSDKLMQAIAMLKLKSKKDTVPVIFLTENPQALVQRYHTHLVAYQENDDYCDLKRFNMAQIIGRIKIGIDAKNRRRSRRYKVALPLRRGFLISVSTVALFAVRNR
jgi:hypothetical protein